jgi:hypothetical protein
MIGSSDAAPSRAHRPSAEAFGEVFADAHFQNVIKNPPNHDSKRHDAKQHEAKQHEAT